MQTQITTVAATSSHGNTNIVRQTSRKASGFSLVELLVVIAIISLLGALLFPTFMTAREKARQAQCTNNLKQIGMAVIQYTQDYDETYPMAVTATGCSPSTGSACTQTTGTPVPVLIDPYLKSAAVWKCPDSVNRTSMKYDYGFAEYLGMQQYTATTTYDNGNGNGNGNNNGSGSDNGIGNGGVDSGFHGNGNNGHGNNQNSTTTTSVATYISSLSDNIAPAGLIMACDIMDAVTVNGNAPSSNSNPATWYGCSTLNATCDGDNAVMTPPSYTIKGLKNSWNTTMGGNTEWPAPRHSAKSLFLYTDGHVKLMDVATEIAHDVSGDPQCEFCNGN